MVQGEEELAPPSTPGEAAAQISLASAASALQGGSEQPGREDGRGQPRTAAVATRGDQTYQGKGAWWTSEGAASPELPGESCFHLIQSLLNRLWKVL